LALGRHALCVQAVPQLVPGQRSVGLERLDDHPDAPLLLVDADPELAQAPLHPGQHPVSGESVEPPVVLGADQVQGPPVEPGHQQSAVVEGGIHVTSRQPMRPSADGEAEPAPVLGLHRQQVADDGLR